MNVVKAKASRVERISTDLHELLGREVSIALGVGVVEAPNQMRDSSRVLKSDARPLVVVGGSEVVLQSRKSFHMYNAGLEHMNNNQTY